MCQAMFHIDSTINYIYTILVALKLLYSMQKSNKSLVPFFMSTPKKSITSFIKQLLLLALYCHDQNTKATNNTFKIMLSLVVFCKSKANEVITKANQHLLFLVCICVKQYEKGKSKIICYFTTLITHQFAGIKSRVLVPLKSNFSPIEIQFWSDQCWILTLMPGPFIPSVGTIHSG